MAKGEQQAFSTELDRGLLAIEAVAGGASEMLDRFKAEIDFAGRLAKARENAAWERLILQAVASVNDALANGTGVVSAVEQAEALLAPIGTAAKAYTIHCCGHAHIDMNWMWNWPETVATVNDTVLTVDRLMEEFPDFTFSQSQASVYQIMKDFLPKIYDRVQARAKEKRWEITANMWVEGDKNLASGEILCRHLLYTKRFIKQEFGLPYDAITLDFEPDTFGHAHTIPTILRQAGVRRYYFCRTGPGPQLFWWMGRDGARVLAWDDRKQWYLGPLDAEVTKHILEFEAATGMKDYLFVYGVGDHGGGPTRADLRQGVKMGTWPIFPTVKFSTFDTFFSIAEAQAPDDLPVWDGEMGFIFEGCYTSQSNIKRANRKSENALVEAEVSALLARGLVGMSYPSAALFTGWRHAMFNQFHDILPGSGVKATYEYSQGLFQEIMAQTTMIKTEALRSIAARVNTASCCPALSLPDTAPGAKIGPGIGGGPGDVVGDATVSRRGAGAVCCDPFVIFNPSPWPRNEVVTARFWDRKYKNEQIALFDDQGAMYPAQVLANKEGWGHNYIDVAIPATDVPGFGYRTFSVARVADPGTIEAHCSGDGRGVLENEFLKVEVEQASGAITHLIDKRTGIDLVPAGERLGVLEYSLEAPHGMTSWTIGQIVKQTPFTSGGVAEYPQNGPYLASVQVTHKLGDSRFVTTISLAAGVPRVDFTLEANWLERGAPDIGVPMLKALFPLALENGTATYEAPNGWVSRSADPKAIKSCWETAMQPAEVPAQKWADLTGTQDETTVGATLVNDCKYGHSTLGNVMRLTLIRSSYDPDPLPEMGKQVIKYALCPHVGAWSPSDATRAGYVFNFPFNVVGTTEQAGSLPASQGFAEILTPNVMLSGIKKAEDTGALIVRLYEMEGKQTLAQLRLGSALAPAITPAIQTDLLEQPLAENTAKMENGILSVDIAPFSMVTVRIG